MPFEDLDKYRELFGEPTAMGFPGIVQGAALRFLLKTGSPAMLKALDKLPAVIKGVWGTPPNPSAFGQAVGTAKSPQRFLELFVSPDSPTPVETSIHEGLHVLYNQKGLSAFPPRGDPAKLIQEWGLKKGLITPAQVAAYRAHTGHLALEAMAQNIMRRRGLGEFAQRYTRLFR